PVRQCSFFGLDIAGVDAEEAGLTSQSDSSHHDMGTSLMSHASKASPRPSSPQSPPHPSLLSPSSPSAPARPSPPHNCLPPPPFATASPSPEPQSGPEDHRAILDPGRHLPAASRVSSVVFITPPPPARIPDACLPGIVSGINLPCFPWRP
ncbi:MAG: hypothetical protein ACPIOQ_84385, partial [Promethearchaeia archaeon]